MKVTEVTNQDGRLCAQLLNLLKAGKWELSGPDITAHAVTVKWVHDLAQQMAAQLSPEKSKEDAGGMKVKAVGPIGSGNTPRKKK